MDEDNTQQTTQEQEYSSDTTDDCTEGYTQSTTASSTQQSSISKSANSQFKQFPAARPRSQFDSDSRAKLIQDAYDASFVDARKKKVSKEKRLKLRKQKTKKLNEDVATIQRKRHAASLKSADDTVPPKKRRSLKKYAPVDTPGQTKLTTYVTPKPISTEAPERSQDSPTQPVPTSITKPPHDTPTTMGTLKSSVSFKSPEPSFQSPQVASVPVIATNEHVTLNEDVTLLPSMLARCRGVCNGCMMQFHLCHEAKWRDTCMHAVIDYFDRVGYDVITKHGIREAYYARYVALAKTELLAASDGLYELDDDIPIPECMRKGSLHDSLQMEEYNTAFRYLERNRMHGVKGYMKHRSNPPEINKKRYGEE